MQSQLMSLFRNGFFHIFGSSVIAQIGGLISSALVIRFLPKENYGSYVEANNLYSYFAIFIGMGLTNAVMQFCNERIPDEEKNSICN